MNMARSEKGENSHYILCVFVQMPFPFKTNVASVTFFLRFYGGASHQNVLHKKRKETAVFDVAATAPPNCWVEMGRRRNRVGGGFVPLLYDYHFGNVSNFCWEISFRFFFILSYIFPSSRSLLVDAGVFVQCVCRLVRWCCWVIGRMEYEALLVVEMAAGDLNVYMRNLHINIACSLCMKRRCSSMVLVL